MPRDHAGRLNLLGRFTLAFICIGALARADTVITPTLWSGLSGIGSAALPRPEPIDLVAILSDSTPVLVTTTERWVKVHQQTTVDAVLHDRSLWRRMHFDDWDRLPSPLRRAGLDALVRSYGAVCAGPRVWGRMTVAEWDLVPQPVRAVAYVRMVQFWSRWELVAEEFGLGPRAVAQTVAAIVMAESWFEHRAVNENLWGNRDLGLAQCSDYCRGEIGRMAGRGEIEAALANADYFNPLIASRVATLWFQRELRRAEGDIALAIRAYHRGLDNALDAKGDTYLHRVLATRSRYLSGASSSPSLEYLATAVSAGAVFGRSEP